MTQGPDDGDGSRPNEPTFADVMNGFSLDAGRKPKRRRWGRGSNTPEPAPPEQPAELTGPISGSAAYGLPPTASEQQEPPPEPAPPPPPQASGAAAVRPYAWTRGRTKSGFELAIETLVSVSGRARGHLDRLPMEHRAVADLLTEQTRSVAEVAALLALPLGVARVLLGDMAAEGTVTVHQTASTSGDVPDLALMERVLSGLRRL
jgi:DNA-directed RNA polymerase specialized sigma24 family protein